VRASDVRTKSGTCCVCTSPRRKFCLLLRQSGGLNRKSAVALELKMPARSQFGSAGIVTVRRHASAISAAKATSAASSSTIRGAGAAEVSARGGNGRAAAPAKTWDGWGLG